MGLISGGHLWMVAILLVIVLVIWGPGKLGDIGGAMGRGLNEFKKASAEGKEQFSKAINDTPPATEGTTTGTPVDEKTKISG